MRDPSRVRTSVQEGILQITLCRGRGNALDRPTLLALRSAFEEGLERHAPPVVLDAEGGTFCTGLDLHEAAGLDRAAMGSLMQEFHRTIGACFAYPGPTVAAIGGHAIAGGALLSLACDVRVIADAGISFGIPGIHLGVAYPDVALEILGAQLAPMQIERVLFDGGRLAPEEAALLELVEEPVPAEHLRAHARRRALELAGVGAAAYASAKASVRGAATRRLLELEAAGAQSPGSQAWLDVWFSPGTRALLDAARASLGRSRGGAGEGGAR